MPEKIVKNQQIHWNNLYLFIKSNLKNILKIYLIISIIYGLYFFIKVPIYSAKLTFYTNYTPSSQASLSLNFLPPSFRNLGSDQLNFSISDFVSSKKFLESIVNNEYIVNNKRVRLVDYWGKNYNNYFTSLNPLSVIQKINKNIMLNKNLTEFEKKSYFAQRKLANSISFSEDRLTALNSITIKLKRDPFLPQKILDDVYLSILDYYKEINSTKAQEKKQFIEDRIVEVKKQLVNSEEKMIDFLQKNIDLSSPALQLKKQSLQREIDLHSQLFVSLSDQLELVKIDEKDGTSTIFLLDEPTTLSNKDGMSLLRGFVYLFILNFLLNVVIRLYINRNELIEV